MQIKNFQELEKAQLLQASRILTQALPLGWTSFEEAEKEIQKRMQLENVCLAALHEDRVIGWGGVMPIYGGNVYELHPLAVEQKWQKKSVGGALLKALEQEAQKRGGRTLWIGADDETGETSLAGEDLYEDFPGKLRGFQTKSHASAFYLKQGYQIMGVLPDANGWGKPDIFLAKRL